MPGRQFNPRKATADAKHNAPLPKFQRAHKKGGGPGWRNYVSPKPSKAEMPKQTSWWTEARLVQDRAAFYAKALAESQIVKARQNGLALNELMSTL